LGYEDSPFQSQKRFGRHHLYGDHVGTFVMTIAMYAVRERWLEAGIWLLSLPLLLIGMVIVSRRTLGKIPD
jgi:high-affinity Fe2+/Pb2+ permease